MSQHRAGSSAKMLLLGDSGSGKSGALISLAQMGYRLVILDFDAGLDVIFNILKQKNDQASLERIYYETMTDKMKSVPGVGMVVPDGTPKAWTKGMELLTHWKMPERKDEALGVTYPAYDLGKPESWGRDTILVVDSMTFMAAAAFRHVLHVNQRSGKTPFQADWGEAMRLTEEALVLLYSDAIKCNVIITSHITFVENEGDQIVKGYPMALGRKLPPKIGRYFNTVVMARTKGSGSNAKKVIVTKGEGLIELKNSSPTTVKPEYPQETGLADLFRDLNLSPKD